MRKYNDSVLETYSTWDRFVNQVVESIETDEKPEIHKPDFSNRVLLLSAEILYLWQFTSNNYIKRGLMKMLRIFHKTLN